MLAWPAPPGPWRCRPVGLAHWWRPSSRSAWAPISKPSNAEYIRTSGILAAPRRRACTIPRTRSSDPNRLRRWGGRRLWRDSRGHRYACKPLDPVIAAQAVVHRATLVTNPGSIIVPQRDNSKPGADRRRRLQPLRTRRGSLRSRSRGQRHSAAVNQEGCRNRVIRPAEPFTWSLRAAANSSRVIPGRSAFGSRSVATRVQV